MPRRKKGYINVGFLRDGICKVKKCKFYNKHLKDLTRHLAVFHKMSQREHQKLPLPTEECIKSTAKWMKYRCPDTCKVEGCKNYGVLFQDVRRHLRNVHKINSQTYQTLKSQTDGTADKIMRLINVHTDTRAAWKDSNLYEWKKCGKKDCPANIQGHEETKFSVFVEAKNVLIKKDKQPLKVYNVKKSETLNHKIFLQHAFANDRHKNAVFHALSHEDSNITFKIDKNKLPKCIVYSCCHCSEQHSINAWGINHFWSS